MNLPRARQGHPDPRTRDTQPVLDAVCEAIIETGHSIQNVKPKAIEIDWHFLRGIPMIGRGVGGAVRGTRPDHSLTHSPPA